MSWQAHPVLILFQMGALISAAVSVYGLLYLRRNGRTPLISVVTALAFFELVWALTATVKVASLDLGTKFLLYRVEIVASAWAPAFVALLVIYYTDRERWLRRGLALYLASVPVAVTLFAPTDPYDLLFIDPHLVTVNGWVTLEHSFGPLFSLFLGWGLLTMLLPIALVAHDAFRGRLPTRPAFLLLFGVTVPLAVVFLKVFDIYPPGGEGVNVAPAGNALFLAVAAYAVFRYRLFEILPVAKERVIETMRDGYLVLDGSSRVLDVNPAALDILDVPVRQDAVGRSLSDLAPEMQPAGDEEEFEFESGDRVIRATTSSLPARSGRSGRLLILHDVTRLRERQEALETKTRRLERAERELKEAQSIASVGHWSWDLETDELEWSDEVYRIFGVEPGEIQPDFPVFMEYVHPEDRERLEAAVDVALEEGGNEVQHRIQLPEGEIRTVYERARVSYRDGEPVKLIGTVQDVTKERELERQLRRKNTELVLLNQVIRHDVRNDLSVLMGWSEYLRRHVDEEGEEAVEKVVGAGRHIQQLTETARDFVEAIDMEEEPELQPVPLRETLYDVVESRRSSYEEAEFAVGEVPEVEVEANELLSTVFLNLLNNAVQHNDKERPEIEVSVEESEGYVVVSVADNGPGIPDDHKGSIFGEGEKGLESPGTGIGLYLVKTLARGYGGDVWIEDNEPEGSIFKVRLKRP